MGQAPRRRQGEIPIQGTALRQYPTPARISESPTTLWTERVTIVAQLVTIFAQLAEDCSADETYR